MKFIEILISVVEIIAITSHVQCFVDPISLGSGFAAISAVGFNFVKDYSYCAFAECCNDNYVFGNIEELRKELVENLYGQHIVIKNLVPAIEAHFNDSIKSPKPLVISFHGTPGVGKNFASEIIAKTLYKKGFDSKFVHRYFGKEDFNLKSKVDQYKLRLSDEVRDAITKCPRSLFIFDEVDRMALGVFDSLTALVDYNANNKEYDSSKAIFIFISNIGGAFIADELGMILKNGILRDETKLSHFEKSMEKIAYQTGGAMQQSNLIESHVIDHFIPFLPLEKAHVYKCAEFEFNRWGFPADKSKIAAVIDEAITYDPKHGFFSVFGCKGIAPKVSVAVHSFS